MKKIQRFIEVNKEGALLGFLIGIAIYMTRDMYPFLINLINNWFPDLEGLYLAGAIIFITMSIGVLIDSYYKPRK